MKMFRHLTLAAAFLTPLALVAACSHEVSHSESDKTGWFGGQYHEANTVYKNADGSTSVETETVTTKDGTTIIERERKTTNLDGTVSTQHETRKIVKGSDTVERDSKTTN